MVRLATEPIASDRVSSRRLAAAALAVAALAGAGCEADMTTVVLVPDLSLLHEGCSRDVDCKGDRICVRGECTDPPRPDLATPDLATPRDLAAADLADLAVADLAPPTDLSVAEDLAVPPDLAVPLDLAVPPDLAIPPDLVVRDLAVVRDLVQPPDLRPPCGPNGTMPRPPPHYNGKPIGLALAGTAQAVAIGDVTGDGLPDVVVGVTCCGADEGKLLVFDQTKQGLAGPTRYTVNTLSTTYHPGSLALGDLNGDGRTDVAFAFDDGIGVMLQQQNGTLAATVRYGSNHMSFTNSYHVKIGDLNHDGRLDVAAIDWGTQSKDLDVFLQDQNGKLAKPQSYVVPHEGYDDLAIGDLDGDGRDDVVVMSGQGLAPHITVALQQQNGTLGNAFAYDIGARVLPRSVAIGDFDGDCVGDIIAVYGGNRPSSAWPCSRRPPP